MKLEKFDFLFLDISGIKRRLHPHYKKYVTLLSLFWKQKEEITVVTAADESHFLSSINLLMSLQEFEPKVQIIYYDLGLSISQAHYIQNEFSYIRLIPFPYDDFPKYFDVTINAGEYAWKAACISLAVSSTENGILWFDAGNIITAKLDLIRKIIYKNGIFIMGSSSTIRQLTHPKSLKYFRCAEFLDLPQFSAAAIGFSQQSWEAKEILDYWLFCSKNKNIIAPKGSSRLNHRQDQAILTLIILEAEEMNARIRKQIARHNDIAFYKFLIHQDVESI
jgi:hypothetical protein